MQHFTQGTKKPQDYLGLVTIARAYLFIQLFSTPILMKLSEGTALQLTINQNLYFPKALDFSNESIMLCVFAYASFFFGSNQKVTCPDISTTFHWDKKLIPYLSIALIIAGYLLKLARTILSGTPPTKNTYYSLLGNNVEFFISMNWLHMLALAFLAVAFYEKKEGGHSGASFYPLLLFLYLGVGALNGSTFALLFPLTIHLSVRQRYHPLGAKGIFTITAALVAAVYLKTFIKTLVINDPSNTINIYAPLGFLVNRLSISFVISAITDNPSFTYGYGMLEQFMYNFRIPGYEYAIPDGNVFGRHYGIVEPNDHITWLGISLVGDFLLHFGPYGMCLGMFISGVTYRMLASLTDKNNPFLWIIYAMLWPIMIHGLESPVSVITGSIVRMIFLCFTVYYIYSKYLKYQAAKK